MCMQCMVIVDFRVNAVYLGQLLSKNLFRLAQNWLCETNTSAQKCSKTHLQASRFSKIFTGVTPRTILEGIG